MEEDRKDKVKKSGFWDARTAVFLIVIVTLVVIIIAGGSAESVGKDKTDTDKLDTYKFLIIPIAGIVSFIIPLILAFSSKYNLGTKLSRGEVRKSIVISLTVMYIILLSLSFDKTTHLATTNVTSNITALNVTAQTVPIQAIGNFTQNFLYVYIVIIGFYFGSRLVERIKTFKELKDVDPLDIAKKRYAMGDIDFDAFKKIKIDLVTKPISQLKIIKATEDEIRIKHEKGDDIDLKDVRMIIEANKKKTKIDPVARTSKKDVFEVTDEMVIHMKQVITPEKDAIEIDSKSTGVESSDISDGITDNEWKKNKDFKVIVIYKQIGETISEMKGKIAP